MDENLKIWLDGETMKLKDAKVSVATHTLHYGTGIFEGIRCYKTDKGSAVFRLGDHVDRLYRSADAMLMKVPFSKSDISDAILDNIRENKHESCYIRPLMFYGDEALGLDVRNSSVKCLIMTWPWGNYLGDDALKKGAKVMISSLKRESNIVQASKIAGNYAKSVIAKREAIDKGYDECIMLDYECNVAEGSAENIFVVKGGRIRTPPLGPILPGITRDSVMEIAGDLGYDVAEGNTSKLEIYFANEIFFTGTAAEVVPVRQIWNTVIGNGKIGPITDQIQEKFFDIVKGKAPEYDKWLTYV